MARRSRLAVRAVVWLAAAPTWEPMTSGGKKIEKPRWIAWRSMGSLQSDVQMRSVRRRIL